MRSARVVFVAFVAASHLAALFTPCPSLDLATSGVALEAHAGHRADPGSQGAQHAAAAEQPCHGPPHALVALCTCGCDDASPAAAAPGAGDGLLAARRAPRSSPHVRLGVQPALPPGPAPAFSFDHVPLRA